jgi:hypothetical protein
MGDEGRALKYGPGILEGWIETFGASSESRKGCHDSRLAQEDPEQLTRRSEAIPDPKNHGHFISSVFSPTSGRRKEPHNDVRSSSREAKRAAEETTDSPP